MQKAPGAGGHPRRHRLRTASAYQDFYGGGRRKTSHEDLRRRPHAARPRNADGRSDFRTLAPSSARLGVQARHALILCPRRVPRADYGYGASTHPPKLSAVVAGNLGHPRRDGRFGVELSYSAPVEPQSGSGWRQHLWLNRPCCFFHFTVWRRSPTPKLPSGLRRFSIGARHGLLEEARGYGLDESTGIYWSNHDWFFWRERGEPYAASLHFFGRGPTLALLRRLVVGLVPAKSL